MSQPSVFDPDVLMNAATNEAGDTRFPAVPEGEYTGIIKAVDKPRDAKGNVVMDVTWSVDDVAVRQVLGLKDVTCRQSIFLDLNGGLLDMGPYKNVQLNKLRDAVGLNNPGQAFRILDLVGKVAKIKVKQRIQDGETYSDVKQVTKLN